MSIELIVKCLELTASDKDGEALLAVRKANALRATLGRTWADMLRGEADANPSPNLNTSTTHAIDWPAVFAIIHEWSPPRGSYAKFLDSVEAQYTHNGSLTPKQRQAILRFFVIAAEKKREFEEE